MRELTSLLVLAAFGAVSAGGSAPALAQSPGAVESPFQRPVDQLPSAQSAELRGEVRSPGGEPVGGARVRLEPLGNTSGAAREFKTNDRGRWRSGRLSAGRWRILVEADGFAAIEGFVDAVPGPGEMLELQLEPDSEAAVTEWLEQANRMLESGKPAAAQAFYEQAITVVRGSQVGAIHSALARAHYLQDDVDEAVKSLQRAILNNPADQEPRRLLTGVLAGAGRESEAVEWLATLDGEGRGAAAGAAFGREVPELELADAPTGRFRSTVAEPSPFSAMETLLERSGTPQQLGVDPDAEWTLEGESFELYVPAGVDGEAARPYGVFVWVSPTPRGRVTDEEMLAVLDELHVIWIGANRSGNPRVRGDRTRLALDAAAAVARTYPVDPERVYVGGYSGGGRMASGLSLLYPDVFTGGVYFMGANFYRPLPVPHKPGALWTSGMQEPSPTAFELARERSRFVFITGTHDFNRAETFAYRDEYLRDGLDRVRLIDVPDVGHYYGFRARELRQALESLDAMAP